MNVTDLRPVSLSEITKHHFSGKHFVTPRRKVEFYDWNSDKKVNLKQYDDSYARFQGKYGYAGEVKLRVNVTNWCPENKCHYITVLEKTILTTKVLWEVVKYKVCISSKLQETLQVNSFDTIKEVKAYLKDLNEQY